MDNRLVVHHIGGRGGNRVFPVVPAFERDIINVIYDADESCISQVMERWENQPSETVVLPYCISGSDSGCTFHLNFDPYSCSIYPLNPKYDRSYVPFYDGNSRRVYDYVLGDAFRPMEKIQLPTTKLDALIDRGEVPGPDFLSLDTQGSELDILNGASRLLDTTILAVQSEVQLHQLYEGVPLFGDICEFLARYNFDFVDFKPFYKYLPIRGKHGFRGEGYNADGDALFLKRPETVNTSSGSVQLNKLAYIATILGQFECAQRCFETTGFKSNPQWDASTADPQPQYIDFISRLADAVALLPQRSVPRFTDVYSYTQSQTRIPVVAPQPPSLLKKYLKTIPPLVSTYRFLRTLPRRIKTIRRSVMIRASWRWKYPDSTVEALFLEFGLKDQCLLAKRNRFLDDQAQPNQIQATRLLKDLSIH